MPRVGKPKGPGPDDRFQPADLYRVAEAVRAQRKAHGLTQSELAGLAGTGLRFISELERAKPGIELAKALAVMATLGLRLRIEAPAAADGA